MEWRLAAVLRDVMMRAVYTQGMVCKAARHCGTAQRGCVGPLMRIVSADPLPQAFDSGRGQEVGVRATASIFQKLLAKQRG